MSTSKWASIVWCESMSACVGGLVSLYTTILYLHCVSFAHIHPVPLPAPACLCVCVSVCVIVADTHSFCCSPQPFPSLFFKRCLCFIHALATTCTQFISFMLYLSLSHTHTHAHTRTHNTRTGEQTFFLKQLQTTHSSRGQLTEKEKLKKKKKKKWTKQCCCRGNRSPRTLPASTSILSLSLPLPISSLHLCAGDARVSFLSIRFVLTSLGRAPLTLPADETRGRGGGRGDEEKLLPLLSHCSITLKTREREREREQTRAEQQPKERTYRIIHTYLPKRNPTLPHSPFQGGHFSSLSPPFLFYPDFFL